MLIQQLFQEQLDKIVSNYTGKTLIFLKGFDLPQIQHIINRKDSLLNAPEILSKGFLELGEIADRRLDFLNAIQTAQSPKVGFYEELLAIFDFLSLVKVDQIIVLENNMLTPWTPCCYSFESAIKLFDYQQEEHTTKDEDLKLLTQYYGDVKLIGDDCALLLPITSEQEGVSYLPFWENGELCEEPDGSEEQIEVDSLRDWQYCVGILSREQSPAVFLQNEDQLSDRHRALQFVAGKLGIAVAFDELSLYQEKMVYDDSQFLPLLKKYWGSQASFRQLLFYKAPDRSKETETISQGQIISEIIDQCEGALNQDTYSNIFITAPTGSGKSILFQIPAVYLAEKYNLVTIVISPLIALMNDQVDQLQRERGISIAACINSTMSMEERIETIAEIHNGSKSLLYLAPELLLTTNLQAFLGGRSIGLVVIDEAHTVTSWGRDFRSDYWFLGDFLKKAKRNGFVFPVLCLTATAVYSGEDDVVNDTINELDLERTIIHLGNVRRDNISFDIHLHEHDEIAGKIDDAKKDIVLNQVREYANKGEKVLAYFPYRSQVDEIYSVLRTSEHIRLRRYHGQLPKEERKRVERDYKSGEAEGLFCTKAFGMGIDVSDIRHIVHFAPTGTLADYVQEIGRAARDPELQGVAHIDFFPGDLRYVRALNGISEMRQYQLKEMLKKICAIYSTKKHRNLLLAAETFSYLFKEDEVENRTKSGLMLLAKDLNSKYSFPVLIVRPKAMLSSNYVNVPYEIETSFLEKYGEYAKRQNGGNYHVIKANEHSRGSDIHVFSLGNTYLVDMAAIWENYYPEMTFGMFKKNFFEHEHIANGKTYRIAPRVRVDIHYKDAFPSISKMVDRVIAGLEEVFGYYKAAEIKQFTLGDCDRKLTEILGERILSRDKLSLLLDIFTEYTNEYAAFTKSRNRLRVLRKRKQAGKEESVYFVSSNAYARLSGFFANYLAQCNPTTEDNSFSRFYPLNPNAPIEIMPILRLLELLNLASYEVRGGEKAEVFVRINDPAKLMSLSAGKYKNNVLQSIQEHHKYNVELLAAFFQETMSTEERWELIEQYFLGNEDYVHKVLHLAR